MSRQSVELEQEIQSIVILGEFNPGIFQPTWLSGNGLLAPEETAEATDLLITREVSMFTVSNMHLQVEQHRFGITTKDPSRGPIIKDLAVGCFLLLEHCPLNAIGLNVDFEFSVGTVEEWHAVGHRLAPKGEWEGVLVSPGMRSLTMEGKRHDCEADRIQITVKPVLSRQNSIRVATNQHYDLKASERSVEERNSALMTILRDDWNLVRGYAFRSAVKLIAGEESDS